MGIDAKKSAGSWLVLHAMRGVMIVSASLSVNAASFDCSKASSSVEKLICAEAELSQLDDLLNNAYTQNLRNNAFINQFRNTQRRWISQRNQCNDANCLKKIYEARIRQIESGREYFLRKGEGEVICERLIQALNTELYKPGHGRVCAFEILQRQPSVRMPLWRRLDLQKDKELYKQFVLARHVGEELWPSTFTDPSPKAGQVLNPKSKRPLLAMPSDDYLNREWASAVQRGDEFYRWDNAIPFPEQGDVLLVHRADPNGSNCPPVSTQLFTSDLRTPKSIVEYSTFSMVPFSFDNKWYWIHTFEAPSPVTSSLSISLLTQIMKPYYRSDICRVVSAEKSIKPE